MILSSAGKDAAIARPHEGKAVHVLIFLALYFVYQAFLLGWYFDAGLYFRAADGLEYYHDSIQLAEGRGFTTKAVFPIQVLYKPAQEPPFDYPFFTNRPLYPVIVAASFKIFGVSQQSAMLTCYAFYVLAGAVVFFLSLWRWGPAVAYAASFAFLTSYEVNNLIFSNHTDMAFMLLLILSFFSALFFPRRMLWLAGVFVAGLCLTRPNGLFPMLILSLAGAWRILIAGEGLWRKRFLYLAIVAFPIIAANVYMLGYNKINYGGYLRYYDIAGSEHGATPVTTDYLPKTSSGKESVKDTLARYRGNFLFNAGKQIEALGFRYQIDEARFAIYALALLWPVGWLLGRDYRLWVIAGTLSFMPQLILLRGHLTMREQGWIIPLMCVAVGLLFGDFWKAARAIPPASLRNSVLALLVVFFVAEMTKLQSYTLEKQARPRHLEIEWQERDFFAACSKLKERVGEGAVIMAYDPEFWLYAVCSDTTTLKVPRTKRALLGSIKKLKTDEFYFVPKNRPIMRPREAGLAPGYLDEIQPYLSLDYENAYIRLYRFDAASMRRDFADEIEKLP